MDVIFSQPVTNETVSAVSDLYSSLGWGQVYIVGSGSDVTELHFRWCKDGPFTLPDVSALGLDSPRRL